LLFFLVGLKLEKIRLILDDLSAFSLIKFKPLVICILTIEIITTDEFDSSCLSQQIIGKLCFSSFKNIKI